MVRGDKLSQLKGQTSSGAGIAIVIVIIGIVAVLLFFPQVFGGAGINLSSIFSGFGGGATATPIGVGPGAAGVMITSFTANPPTIEGGDSATFTMTVQNNGGIEATNVQYDIFGLSDSNSWSGKQTAQTGLSTLAFADFTRQIPGETTVQEWESTSVKKNTDITYPITGRVDYKYKTEADLLLTLFGRDNPNIKNTGIIQSTIGQIAVTTGPIAITPKGTIPLIGKSTTEFRVTFDINNNGGGRPYSGSKTTDLDKIKISAQGCTLTGETTIRLINKVKTVSCTVKPSISSDGQETKSLKLTLDYNYIVESTANVKVLKQPEQ